MLVRCKEQQQGLEGNELVYYSIDHAKNEWRKISTITESATGPSWIIQSQVRDSYAHGNFEVIVHEGKLTSLA